MKHGMTDVERIRDAMAQTIRRELPNAKFEVGEMAYVPGQHRMNMIPVTFFVYFAWDAFKEEASDVAEKRLLDALLDLRIEDRR